ncbi:hypothetical protein ACJW30_12G087900 [Castanea mollissima]
METCFIILVSLCKRNKLPLGPFNIPILSNFLMLCKPFSELEHIIRKLHANPTTLYMLIITIYIGSRPAIFIANRSLAHKALVQNSAIFADRPPALPTNALISSNQHNINSASYAPSGGSSAAISWVLDILLNRLGSYSKSREPIVVKDHFQYCMFYPLVLMCFGDKLDESQIKKIEDVQRRLLLSFGRFRILNFLPSFSKMIFRKRWEELLEIQRDRNAVLIPMIKARRKFVLSYVDALLELELPEEKRKLEEEEMVSLCSEFLDAGTDTTSTALEWIMANLVKNPHIQERLIVEIKGVVGERGKEVKEEDLNKMPYLKAVVLEGLRRHPPGHFVVPHAMTEDVVLDGYLVPKNATLNFMVAEMGWDPKVWEDPMAFKPERFLSGGDGGGEVFDITGSREIKMMPFGVGRRICPGSSLAILHLEYFVANLVCNFEWKAVEGDEVDLSEKQEFTMVMKNPLKAHLSPIL